MVLKFNKIDDKLIVNLCGELDHHSSEQVRVKIDDRIDRDNIKKVIMDFDKVTFMDSSGIGVVIGRFKKVQNRNGKVCVVNVNSRIDRVVYGCPDVKAGGAESIFNIITNPNLNHCAEVVSGVCEEECAVVMKEFFKRRRKENKAKKQAELASVASSKDVRYNLEVGDVAKWS